jgi:phosphoribosylanthranilate isomerase
MSRVLVKLCGLNTLEAVEAALAAGADALGFVLAPSPRRVTLSEAERLLACVPGTVEAVAVFARPTRDELERTLALPFDAFQVEAGLELPGLPPERFYLPVLSDRPELDELSFPVPFPSGSSRSLRGAFVLDGPRGGGQGIPADPARAARLARRLRLVLAGGLTPENVGERIRVVRPFAVDASSGLERTRGHKDPERITAFVRAVRAAETELPPSDGSTP